MAIYNITVQAKSYGTQANLWTIDGTGGLSGTDFSSGTNGDIEATATAFKDAVNNKTGLQDIIVATSVGTVITLKAMTVGSAQNAYTLSKTDGGISNFTLSGSNFTGGIEGQAAFLFDSDIEHSGIGSKVFEIKNHGVPMLDLGRHETNGPEDLTGESADANILNLFDNMGTKSSQLILNNGFHISSDNFSLSAVTGGLTPGGNVISSMALHPNHIWLGTGTIYSGRGFGVIGPGTVTEKVHAGTQATNIIMSADTNNPVRSVGSVDLHLMLQHEYATYSGGFLGLDGLGRTVGITGYEAFSFLSVIGATNPDYDAFRFNTSNTLTNSNLFSIQNNGVEKFLLDKDGNLTIAGSITTGGGPPPTNGYRQVSTDNYNVQTSDYILGVVTSSIQIDILIPTAQCTAGRILIIKDISGNASGNIINILPQGGRTVDGTIVTIVYGNYGVCRLFCNGTNWFTF